MNDAEIKEENRDKPDETAQQIEKKCEAWGNNIEQKITDLEKRMPPPVNAFFDALCISVLLAVCAWIISRIGWIGSMPSGLVFTVIFGAIFVISLVFRLVIKPGKQGKPES